VIDAGGIDHAPTTFDQRQHDLVNVLTEYAEP